MKLVKRLVVLALICGLVMAGSYAGVRTTVGRMLGDNASDMGTRTIKFTRDSIPGMPGQRVMWVFTFSPTKLPGARTVRVWVSPTGGIIATSPKDLDTRLEAYAKAREPS